MPGPGEYDTFNKDKLLMKGGNKFTMGGEKKCKDNTVKETGGKPGPSVYAIVNKNRGPSFGFGSGKRSDMAVHGVPGPGQYKVPTKVVDVAMYSNAHGHKDHKFV